MATGATQLEPFGSLGWGPNGSCRVSVYMPDVLGTVWWIHAGPKRFRLRARVHTDAKGTVWAVSTGGKWFHPRRSAGAAQMVSAVQIAGAAGLAPAVQLPGAAQMAGAVRSASPRESGEPASIRGCE